MFNMLWAKSSRDAYRSRFASTARGQRLVGELHDGSELARVAVKRVVLACRAALHAHALSGDTAPAGDARSRRLGRRRSRRNIAHRTSGRRCILASADHCDRGGRVVCARARTGRAEAWPAAVSAEHAMFPGERRCVYLFDDSLQECVAAAAASHSCVGGLLFNPDGNHYELALLLRIEEIKQGHPNPNPNPNPKP